MTGIHKKLEVINSGSFTELDKNTINLIEKIAIEKNISEVHFECHYLFRKNISEMRERFQKNNINLKIKCGVETFDSTYRKEILSTLTNFLPFCVKIGVLTIKCRLLYPPSLGLLI